MVEYKVITERDARISGAFNPENLERTLNSYAADGWRVVSAFTAASVWKSLKSEIMLVLEREVG
jgi:hypothetical protein